MTTTPFRLITRAWLIASLALTIIGVWLAFRLYAPRWSAPVPLALTFAFLGAFEPVRYALWLGQTTPLVFAMVLWSLWLLRKQRDATAGLLLSIPVFLKLTPVVFALVWAWQRRGRALAGLTVGLAGLVLLSILTVGLDANAAYVHRVSEIARITLVTFNNHSLPALLTRLSFDHPNVSAFTMLPQPAWVRWTVASTMAGATGLMLVVTRHGRSEDGALLEAYGMLALLLVPSIAWTHYFVFLLPAALGLRACLPEGRHQRLVGIAGLAMLAFCARPLVTDQTAFDPSRHGMIATPTCGALGMLALLGAVAWRQRPRAVAGNTIPGRPLAGCGAGARS
jgi:MYXO-CTERM domain-containing protein